MIYTQAERDVIVADSLEGFTYRQKRALLCALDQKSADSAKCEQWLIKSCGGGVYNKMRALFCDDDYRAAVLGALEDKDVVCVPLGGADYPERLAQIPVPPLVLYCRGRTQLLARDCFAVVGSRRTPAATMAACRRISAELSSALCIVTGIADGADTAAARGALESGNLICVLPGGHACVSSQANARLVAEAEERALTVSEWPPDTAVLKYMFTARNRIIAGLSLGVLVAAAPKKSGALITAGYAADYGREVFALPHSLGVAAGEGSNELIKNGAALCCNALDIFSAFGLEYKTQTQNLTPEEAAVIGCLRECGRAHIQQIAQAAGIKVFQAVTVLSSLELKGLAVRCGGNMYQAV